MKHCKGFFLWVFRGFKSTWQTLRNRWLLTLLTFSFFVPFLDVSLMQFNFDVRFIPMALRVHLKKQQMGYGSFYHIDLGVSFFCWDCGKSWYEETKYFTDGAFVCVIISEILEQVSDFVGWKSSIFVQICFIETFFELLDGDSALFRFDLFLRHSNYVISYKYEIEIGQISNYEALRFDED